MSDECLAGVWVTPKWLHRHRDAPHHGGGGTSRSYIMGTFLRLILYSECGLDSLKIPCSWGQQGKEGFMAFKTSVREC